MYQNPAPKRPKRVHRRRAGDSGSNDPGRQKLHPRACTQRRGRLELQEGRKALVRPLPVNQPPRGPKKPRQQ